MVTITWKKLEPDDPRLNGGYRVQVGGFMRFPSKPESDIPQEPPKPTEQASQTNSSEK